MFCRKCGKEIRDTDTFCTYCGTRIVMPEGPEKSGTARNAAPRQTAQATSSQQSQKRSCQSTEGKNGGCGTVILIIIAVVIGMILLNKVLGNKEKPESGTEQAEDSAQAAFTGTEDEIRHYLENYLDSDTRIIYTAYDGLAQDVEQYLSAHAEELQPIDDKEGYAKGILQSEHVKEEMQDALKKMERKVCVIGAHYGSGKGYLNTGYNGYNDGVFRSFPYSTFWLKSSKCVTNFLPASDEDHYFGERWYVYSLDYYPIGNYEISDMKTRIDRETDDIIACIPSGADLWLKCRVVHDELIRRASYDHDYEEHCHDLYGALVKHKTVCEGYALAFRYILEQIGENCDVIVSTWDEQPTSGIHAWNCIYTNTEERYIDVTWDDLDWRDTDGNEIVMYDYFGLTGEEIAAIDSHDFNKDYIWTTSGVEPVAFNYYRHENCMLSSYDEWELTEVFWRQYTEGKTTLTVRFDNSEAYDACLGSFVNSERVSQLFSDLGYYGYGWWYSNDSTHTLTIGLGQLQENG